VYLLSSFSTDCSDIKYIDLIFTKVHFILQINQYMLINPLMPNDL
jgi:hypothetical protein